MSDDKLEMKQLSKKGGGKPMIQLINASNFMR